MVKALLFDFDGVLASSDAPRFKALQSFAAKHGVEIGEQVKLTARGKTTQKVLHEILPHNLDLADTILNEFNSGYREHITEHVKPIEFTVNFIRNYHGTLPIAIASMSSKQTIERLTKHFGIYEKIAYIVSKDEVTHHKPDPEIYLKAAADLHMQYEDCLVFEDTVIGFHAATNAHMSCCVVLNGENNKEEFTGMNVYSFVATEYDLKNTIEIHSQAHELA
jgi:HAD superfamily hydrolase (TIGR01509 family)